jgi:replicative DNA helicase
MDDVAVPPYDKEAEAALIGCALFSTQAAEVMLLAVQQSDFYFDSHRHCYRAVATLQREGTAIDAVTFAEQLQRDKTLQEVGGVEAVMKLLESVPHSEHVRHYADIVLERSRRRKLIAAANAVSRRAYQPDGDAQELLNELSRQIDEIQGDGSADIRIISAVAKSLRERQQRSDVPISTGIQDVDAALKGGYRPGQLIVVGARPGMGKTAYALGLLEGAALQARAALMFSLEMDAEEIVARAAADDEKFQVLQQTLIYFEDRVFALDQICATIRRAVARNRVSLVVIDYLTLIETGDKRSNPAEAVEKITRALKRLARQQGVAIVVLSQLNRDLEKRDDKRPKLSDLRQSGAIEQDADIVQFLYRPEVYDPQNSPGEAEIIIAKQRSYRTSTVKVAYKANLTRFVPFEQRDVGVEEYSFDK